MTAQDFFSAVQKGDLGAVQEMVERAPALVDAVNENGVSAILISVYTGQRAITDFLTGRRTTLDVFEAAATGAVGILRKLLDKQPALVGSFSPDGFPPLGLACFFGHRDAATLLIERGAEVNARSRNPMKVMPLHSAAASRQPAIIRLLLEHGAEVNAAQESGFVPLHEAARSGNVEMIRLLLDYGAEKGIASDNGKTPLDYARETHHLEAAALLEG